MEAIIQITCILSFLIVMVYTYYKPITKQETKSFDIGRKLDDLLLRDFDVDAWGRWCNQISRGGFNSNPINLEKVRQDRERLSINNSARRTWTKNKISVQSTVYPN